METLYSLFLLLKCLVIVISNKKTMFKKALFITKNIISLKKMK